MATPTVSELKKRVRVIEDLCNQILAAEKEVRFPASAHLLDQIDQVATDIEQSMKNCVVPQKGVSSSESQAGFDDPTTATIRKEFFELWQLEGSLYRVQRELFTLAPCPDLHNEPPHNDDKLDIDFKLIKPLPGDESKRLSQRLGLEYPYDRSNSRMDLKTLVIKVLKRYRFNDVLTMSKYIGSKKLHSVAGQAYHEEIPSRLSQIFRSIGRAEKRLRSRELGFANARLAGLKSRPKLDETVEKFMDGKITLEETFIEQEIRRVFGFEIIVSLPSGKKHDDYLEGLENSCPDATLCIGAAGRIGMRFERLALIYSDAVSSALKDISIVIPNPRIMKVSLMSQD